MNNSVTVLIVDDMPAMRSILKRMLEEIGFTKIMEAEDGEMAWELIQASEFGLVVADWNMPGMSGGELLRALRASAKTRQLPFILVTAENDHAHIAAAFDSGVTDYIVKPFGAAQLKDKIDKALPY